MSLSLKTSKMSRLKQNRIIDNAIQSVASITESQCSLSEKDLIVINEALERLQFLKRKKGKTNEQIQQEIAKVVELLIDFFAKDVN
jgi:ABC-type phosphate transport system auxiliary subunit